MHTRSRLLCTFVTEAASVCMADEKSGLQNRAMRLLSALQWMQLFSTEAITYRLALLRLTSNVIEANSFFSLLKIFLFLMEIKIEGKMQTSLCRLRSSDVEYFLFSMCLL